MAALDTARRAADAHRKALARRDDAIREARSSGASLRAIAQAVGLTHTAIAKILRRSSNPS